MQLNQPVVSIVVPVYNVAQYLAECLESLVQQTVLPHEIIIVNDGSTDHSLTILTNYAARYPSIILISQENQGLSVARNVGLAAAQGKYILFVDSDDKLKPGLIDFALPHLETLGLDVFSFNAEYFFEDGRENRLIYQPLSLAGQTVSGKTWLKAKLTEDRLMHMVWLHIYRHDFLTTHHFQFIPNLIHEDVIWTSEALLVANTVYYTNESFYLYRIAPKKQNPERKLIHLEKTITSTIVNAERLGGLIAQEQDSELVHLLSHELVDGALSIFHKINQLPKPRRKVQLRHLLSIDFFTLLQNYAASQTQKGKIRRLKLKTRLATLF